MFLEHTLVMILAINVVSNLVLLVLDVYLQGSWARLSALCGWTVAFILQLKVAAYKENMG
jgi:hypothetical protein